MFICASKKKIHMFNNQTSWIYVKDDNLKNNLKYLAILLIYVPSITYVDTGVCNPWIIAFSTSVVLNRGV